MTQCDRGRGRSCSYYVTQCRISYLLKRVPLCLLTYLLTDESKSTSSDEGNSSPSTLECSTSHPGEPIQDVQCALYTSTRQAVGNHSAESIGYYILRHDSVTELTEEEREVNQKLEVHVKKKIAQLPVGKKKTAQERQQQVNRSNNK